MKLLTSFTAIIAAASASKIFSQKPQADHFANAADAYQAPAEYQQPGYAAQALSSSGYDLSGHGRPSAEKTAKILAYHSENDGHSYNYGYETENGIKAQEIGRVIKGTEAEGAFAYLGDDGVTYTVTYVADAHGFRAQGAHLPTPPPIPEAILKSLEENAQDEANGIYDDGQYHEEHQADQQAYQYNGHNQDYTQAQISSESGYHY